MGVNAPRNSSVLLILAIQLCVFSHTDSYAENCKSLPQTLRSMVGKLEDPSALPSRIWNARKNGWARLTSSKKLKNFDPKLFQEYRASLLPMVENDVAIPSFLAKTLEESLEAKVAFLEVLAEKKAPGFSFEEKFKTMSPFQKKRFFAHLNGIFPAKSISDSTLNARMEALYRDYLESFYPKIYQGLSPAKVDQTMKNIVLARFTHHKLSNALKEMNLIKDPKGFAQFTDQLFTKEHLGLTLQSVANVGVLSASGGATKLLMLIPLDYRFSKHIKIPVEFFEQALKEDFETVWARQMKPYLDQTYPRLAKTDTYYHSARKAWEQLVQVSFVSYLAYQAGDSTYSFVKKLINIHQFEETNTGKPVIQDSIPIDLSDSEKNKRWEEWKKANPESAANPKSEAYLQEHEYIFGP